MPPAISKLECFRWIRDLATAHTAKTQLAARLKSSAAYYVTAFRFLSRSHPLKGLCSPPHDHHSLPARPAEARPRWRAYPLMIALEEFDVVSVNGSRSFIAVEANGNGAGYSELGG